MNDESQSGHRDARAPEVPTLTVERDQRATWCLPRLYIKENKYTVIKCKPFRIVELGLELSYTPFDGELHIKTNLEKGTCVLQIWIADQTKIVNVEQAMRLAFTPAEDDDDRIVIRVLAFDYERAVTVTGRTATWNTPAAIWNCYPEGKNWVSHPFTIANHPFHLVICPRVKEHAAVYLCSLTPGTIAFGIRLGVSKGVFFEGIIDMEPKGFRFPLQQPMTALEVSMTIYVMFEDLTVKVANRKATWLLSRHCLLVNKSLTCDDFVLGARTFSLTLGSANYDDLGRRDLHIQSKGAAGNFRVFVQGYEEPLDRLDHGEEFRLLLNCGAGYTQWEDCPIVLEFVGDGAICDVDEERRTVTASLLGFQSSVSFTMAKRDWLIDKEGNKLRISADCAEPFRASYLLQVHDEKRRLEDHFSRAFPVVHSFAMHADEEIKFSFSLILIPEDLRVNATRMKVVWHVPVLPSWQTYFKPGATLCSDSFTIKDSGPFVLKLTPKTEDDPKWSSCQLAVPNYASSPEPTLMLKMRSKCHIVRQWGSPREPPMCFCEGPISVISIKVPAKNNQPS